MLFSFNQYKCSKDSKAAVLVVIVEVSVSTTVVRGLQEYQFGTILTRDGILQII
jgi:hypothetical protein